MEQHRPPSVDQEAGGAPLERLYFGRAVVGFRLRSEGAKKPAIAESLSGLVEKPRRVTGKNRQRRTLIENLQLRTGDRLNAAQALEVRRSDVGNDRNLRRGDLDETSDLARRRHPHLEHRGLNLRIEGQDR